MRRTARNHPERNIVRICYETDASACRLEVCDFHTIYFSELMEGFWGILKSEMYYLRKFASRDDLILAIERYLYFYNNKRYQQRLRCMTPMEFHRTAA